MTTALITHPDCLNHATPPGHPEQIARLEYINDALSAPNFAPLVRVNAPLAADDDILRCHPKSHVQMIRDARPDDGVTQLDADTFMSPGSLDAALRSVGAVTRAVDMVLSGEASNAFCAIRPPGHHAEQETPMGFCLFGNVAIAAKHALDHHGLGRVAIVDFDVHHGNGTQALVEEDERILFISSHQSPLWPGTGAPHETGVANNVLNIPLPPRSGSVEFRAMFENHIIPKVSGFKPDLVIISAGFDAHVLDPLAQLELTTDDFVFATEKLCDLADTACNGRLVSSLEGGYDLDALAESVSAHVKVLMERGK